MPAQVSVSVVSHHIEVTALSAKNFDADAVAGEDFPIAYLTF